MLDQAIRFGAILGRMEATQSPPEKEGSKGKLTDPPLPPLIKGGNKELILEVGSGSRGLTAFTDQPVIGVDVAFPGGPAHGLTPIKASATALPFKDACCDQVVCSDMLEHLNGGVRKEAIGELLRVTRGTLLLACPCSGAARRVDGFLGRLYSLLHVPIPDWLAEHLALTLPDPEDIRLTLLGKKSLIREIPGESVLTHFIVSLLISTKAANRFWTKIFQNRPDRARKLGNWRLLKLGPAYRRLWEVRK